MASQRPGFSRADTDRHFGEEGDVELTGGHSRDPGVGDSKGTYEIHDLTAKDGTKVDISAGDVTSPPEYEDAGDGFAKVTEPVETAKDLVTQVLHIDDDPNLNPYTFRLFFLGRSLTKHSARPTPRVPYAIVQDTDDI